MVFANTRPLLTAGLREVREMIPFDYPRKSPCSPVLDRTLSGGNSRAVKPLARIGMRKGNVAAPP